MADIPVQVCAACANKSCPIRDELDSCISCFEAKFENVGVGIGPVDYRGPQHGPHAFVYVGQQAGYFPNANEALASLNAPVFLRAQEQLKRSGQAIAVDAMTKSLF